MPYIPPVRRIFTPPPPPGSIVPIVVEPFPLFKPPHRRVPLWGGVYAITNVVNGKLYIGQSQDIRERLADHRQLLRRSEHHCSRLLREYQEYGPCVFMASVLEVCGFRDRNYRLAVAAEGEHIKRAYERDADILLNNDITVARAVEVARPATTKNWR